MYLISYRSLKCLNKSLAFIIEDKTMTDYNIFISYYNMFTFEEIDSAYSPILIIFITVLNSNI